MKKMNKKGFTIVELVIVIAVIAILAAVMIPTFSGIVKKAQESAAMQEISAAYKEAYALVLADDGKIEADEEETVNNIKFTFTADGTDVEIDLSANDDYKTGYTVDFVDGAITVTKS